MMAKGKVSVIHIQARKTDGTTLTTAAWTRVDKKKGLGLDSPHQLDGIGGEKGETFASNDRIFFFPF